MRSALKPASRLCAVKKTAIVFVPVIIAGGRLMRRFCIPDSVVSAIVPGGT